MKLFVVLMAAATVMALPQNPARSSSPISFSSTESVPMEVVEQKGEFKLIKLPAAKWVCTNATMNTNEDPFKDWQKKFNNNGRAAMVSVKDSTSSKMFKKLVKYIFGVNSEGVSIDMTTPVINKIHKVYDGQVDSMTCFYTGKAWADKKLPEPLDNEIWIHDVMKDMHFYVRTFSGFALSMDDWQEQRKLLIESLKSRDDAEINGDFITAGYDGPWTVENRRNEVWIPKKDMMEEPEAEPEVDDQVTEDEQLESISYSVVDSGEVWELREYPAAKWICTAMADIDPSADPMNGWEEKYNNNPYVAMASAKWKEQTTSKMFMKLFKYIAGVNKGNVEIDMTTPVTMSHNPTIAPKEAQEMCFWLGSKYQTEKPPAPLFDDAQVIAKDGFQVYVHRFGGFALSFDDFHKPYMTLKSVLEKEGKKDVASINWAHVSYNSPFTPKNRRNEVWILKKP